MTDANNVIRFPRPLRTVEGLEGLVPPAPRKAHGVVEWDLQELATYLRRALDPAPYLHNEEEPIGPEDVEVPLAISRTPDEGRLYVWSSMTTIATILGDGTLHLHPDAHALIEEDELLESEVLDAACEWLSEEVGRVWIPRGYEPMGEVPTGVPGMVSVAFIRRFDTAAELVAELTAIVDMGFDYHFDPDTFRSTPAVREPPIPRNFRVLEGERES